VAKSLRDAAFPEGISGDIKNEAAKALIQLVRIELLPWSLIEVLSFVTEIVGAGRLHIDTRQLARDKLFEIATLSEAEGARPDVMNALIQGLDRVANQEIFDQVLRDEAIAHIITIEAIILNELRRNAYCNAF